MSQSRIISFYYGDASDHKGRSLDELQTQTLDGLERTHDYIQWLFPLPERSSANPDAPLISLAEIREFSEDEELRTHLVGSLLVMLRLFGLELVEVPGRLEIRRSEAFKERSEVWLTPFNHNLMRITRILRSLHLLGCGDHAKALLVCLEGIYRDYHTIIGQKTFQYWKTALR
jgi:Opioid growth factor receptor (OGFr) conserved region